VSVGPTVGAEGGASAVGHGTALSGFKGLIPTGQGGGVAASLETDEGMGVGGASGVTGLTGDGWGEMGVGVAVEADPGVIPPTRPSEVVAPPCANGVHCFNCAGLSV
jgi:hypothetical protein